MTQMVAKLQIGLVFLAILSAEPAVAEQEKLRAPTSEQRLDLVRRARVWEPTDIAAKDLYQGPGGELPFAVGDEVSCEFVPSRMSGGTSKFACRLDDGTEIKVKYDPDGKYKEVFGEVLGTRLFWALGFPADRMLPVSVTCRKCPADPFEWVGSHAQDVPIDSDGNIRAIPPSADIGTHRFDLAVIEERLPGRNLETRDHEGWSWDMLDSVDSGAGGATRAELDAFRLLNAFVQNADNKSKQNKLLCPPEAVSAGDGGRVDCRHPILYVSDLGSVFGNGGFTTGGEGRVDYDGWRERRVWKDEAKCQARLASIGGPFLSSTLADPVIGEEGRALLASLLDQLSDAQIADLFRVSRIEQLHQKTADGAGGEREVTIADWVELFKQKRREISEHPGCGSSLASLQARSSQVAFPPRIPARFERATQLFDPVGYHEVRLRVDEAAWKGYLAQAGKRGGGSDAVSATVQFDGTEHGAVGIRPYGYGSRSHNPAKPNIRLEFDYADKRHLGPEGIAVLRLKGSGQDPTFLRQPLSQAAVQAAGGIAPRFSWARISVNGADLGFYQLFEHVDARLFAHRFGSDAGNHYQVVKACLGLNCSGATCTKLASRYEGTGNVGEIVRLAQLARDGGRDWFKQAGRMADTPALLAQYAVEVWASDIDGLAAAGQNYDVYVNPRNDLLEFIPRGMDKGFGTQHNDAWYEIATPWGPPNHWCKGRVDEFYTRLWETDAAKQALLDKLHFLQCGPLSDATLLPLIDGYRELLRDDIYADPKGVASAEELDTAFEQMKDYVRRRNAYMNRTIGSCD